MDLYEFYKELYHKENDRRQEVTNALNIPLAVITALTTVGYILITTFSYTVHYVLTCVFILCILVSTVFLVLSIYHLSKAFINLETTFEYKGIPYAKSLFDWHEELEKYYQDNFPPKENYIKKSNEHFKNIMINHYVESIDHNTYVNDQKHSHIFNSKKYLMYCLLSCLVALPFYGWGFFNRQNETYKVEIVNSKSYLNAHHAKGVPINTKQSMSDQHKTPQSPVPPTRPAPPPPPTPPQIRRIKEGKEPPKPPVREKR